MNESLKVTSPQERYLSQGEVVQTRLLRLVMIGLAAAVIIGAVSQIGAIAEGRVDKFLFVANIPLPLTPLFYILFYASFAIMLVLSLMLLNQGRLSSARAFFVSALSLFTVSFYLLNEPNSVYVMLLLLPIISAGLMLERRGMVATALFVIGSFALIMVLWGVGAIDLVRSEPSSLPEVTWVGIPLLILVAVLIGGFAGGQRGLIQRSITIIEELRGLSRFSRLLGENVPLDEILNQAVEIIRDQYGFYHAQVFLIEERSGVVALASGTGIRSEGGLLRRRIAPDDTGVINQVIQTGKSRQVNMSAPASDRSEFLPATRAEMLIPLRYRDQIVGVLDVQSVQSVTFSPDDTEALEAIAAEIGVAVQVGRYSEQLNQGSRERAELLEQSRELRNELQRAQEEISGRAWGAYLENRFGKSVSYQLKGGAIQPAVPASARPQGELTAPRLEVVGGDQVLSVPILSRGQVLGIMEFRAVEGQIWDERSLELARAISQRLALALDNLRLFERAQLAVAREQIANQIATVLQSRSDIDSLVDAAVEAFQQALGATRASVRLGIMDGDTSPKQLNLPQEGSPSPVEAKG